jgi:hypothetical protein
MSEALILEIANALIDEVFAQSVAHNNTIGAPVVWQSRGAEWFLHVDGTIDMLKLAKAVERVL